MIRTYRALFVAQIQAAAQYRVQSVLWLLLALIRPLIFLAAWVAVANARGGEVGSYDVRDFAAYYIALTLVLQLIFSWNAYDFEWQIRNGQLSPRLLRPLHPIHYAVPENVVFKMTTFIPLLVFLAIVALTFEARFRTTPVHLVLFVPSVLLGAALSFLSGWALATVAFWTTRVHAITTLWDRGVFIFSGMIAPLSLLPGPLQTISLVLPFGYLLGVPAEILRGGVDIQTALLLIAGQAVWVAIAYLVLQRAWSAGLRQYTAVGG
jgi:ABC-2 type transport system permease protein